MKPSNNHFNVLAPIYEFVIRPGNREKFWAIVDMPANGIILDAGGGTGRVSQFLSGLDHQVIVADVSCEMLHEAQLKPHLRPVCTPTEILPFAANTFDRVIMVDALHHVGHQAETAKELFRVLKPGGHLVIEEPDITHFGVKLIALAEKVALMRSHFLNANDIAGLFPMTNKKLEIQSIESNVYVSVTKLI